MKNKILGLPKAAVIVIGIVITALFLVLMNLVGGVVAHLTSIADSYTLQLIAEIGVAIYAIGMLYSVPQCGNTVTKSQVCFASLITSISAVAS
jgi:hypothetical protein